MDAIVWRNPSNRENLSSLSTREDESHSSSNSSPFILITGVQVDNIPNVKTKVFIVARAGAKTEKTIRLDSRNGSAAWVNLKMKPTDFDSVPPASISFELHRDRPLFSSVVLAKAERPFQDFIQPGTRRLILNMLPSHTNAAKFSLVLTIDFENNVEDAAEEIFIPPFDPELNVTTGVEHVISIGQNINPGGRLDLLSSGLGSLLDSFEPYAKLLEKASKAHPAAQVAYFFISSAYTVVKHQYDTDASIVELFQIMMRTYEIASMNDILHAQNTISKDFKFRDMIHQSIECSLFISAYSSKGYLRRLTSMNVTKKISNFKTAFENIGKEFNGRLAYKTAVEALTMRPSVEFIAIEATLKQMRPVDPLGPRSSYMPGTRRETLRMITNWISQGEQSVIWLHGMAGTGKSSLMGSLSDIALEMGICSRLGAFIRFDRFEYSDSAFFVKTLAYELARFDDRLGRVIADAVRMRMVNHTQLSRQFSALVLEPLEMFAQEMKDEGPVLVLVDGLNECERCPQRGELLRLLASGFGPNLPFMRLVIASRLEEDIKRVLQHNSQIHAIVLDTASSEATEDIKHFINTKLLEIGEDYPEIQKYCQSTDAASKLADRASGLFIWASTIHAFIADLPLERLPRILSTEVPASALKALTNLYQIALVSIANETGDDDIKSSIRTILGSIIVVTSQAKNISLSILNGVLPFIGVTHVSTLLDKMGSLVYADYNGNLHLLHESFDDFLLDRGRCGEDWAIDLKAHHRSFTVACLRQLHAWYDNTQMINHYEFERQRAWQNFLAAVHPDDQFTDADVLYSSTNWYQHASTCSDIFQDSALQDLLDRMFKVYFLRWLEGHIVDLYNGPLSICTEVLIPTDMTFRGHQIIREHLETFLRAVQVTASGHRQLTSSIILYLALLINVPSDNLFRKHYLPGFYNLASSITSFQVDCLIVSSFGIVDSFSSMEDMELQIHLATFTFGQPLLIMKDFKGSRWLLVHALTGTVQQRLIIPHDQHSMDQCIESDGILFMIQHLGHSKVKLFTWNTNGELNGPLQCSANPESSVEFSISESENIFIYNGRIFASTYNSPCTIQSWNLITHEYISLTIDIPAPMQTTGQYLYVDQYCAILGWCGETSGIYHVYNPEDGECFQLSIEIHFPIICTAVSKDRTRLAVAQTDTTVMLLDFMTLEHVTEAYVCFSPVQSMSFSPDGLALLVCTQTGLCVLNIHKLSKKNRSSFLPLNWPPLGSPGQQADIAVYRIQETSNTFSANNSTHYGTDTEGVKVYASMRYRDGTKSLVLLENGTVLLLCHALNMEEQSVIIAHFPVKYIKCHLVAIFEVGNGKLIRITASDSTGILQASLDFQWSELYIEQVLQ